jgi:hypothetical protein
VKDEGRKGEKYKEHEKETERQKERKDIKRQNIIYEENKKKGE